MIFGMALEMCRSGSYIRRPGWNGKGMFLVYIANWDCGRVPGIERISFIAMKTADNKLVPWLASQTDILADDWEQCE
jgi:hypothetical protein